MGVSALASGGRKNHFRPKRVYRPSYSQVNTRLGVKKETDFISLYNQVIWSDNRDILPFIFLSLK